MNWEEIGAIGQILGAAAVFVSLGYLALQVKVANATAQQNSQNVYISDYSAAFQTLARDRELTELVRRALSGLDALDGNEQTRFHYLGYAEYMRTQNMYRQLISNRFDSLLAQPLISFFAQYVGTKGGSQWWGTVKGGADPDFVAYIDALLADPKRLESAQPWYARE